MKIIQGFIQIPSLSDNTVGGIAKFGEFSAHAQSYTKDIRNYSDTTKYPHFEVITVKAIDERSGNIELPKNVVDNMLLVVNWVYTQYTNSSIPLNSSKKTFEQAITDEFSFVRKCSVGEIMPTSQPSKRLMDYIQVDIVERNDIYRTTLWLNDARFRVQYRYYDIHVIPPVPEAGSLQGPIADVAQNLSRTKYQQLTAQINNYNRVNKVTAIQTMSLKWHDVNDVNSKLDTEWTLLIHGNAGSDTEHMKEAIREWLETNSDSEDWPKIYPELFSANEFIMIPLWDQIATLKDVHDDGLYTTQVTMGLANLLIEQFVPATFKYGDNYKNFINLNMTISSVFYRSMMFLALGNPANKDGKYSMIHVFPDYMAVSTESPDFARMSQNTQAFVLKLNEVFNYARLYDPNKLPPENTTITTKGGREYIGFDFDGFTYYIMTRLGYLREI